MNKIRIAVVDDHPMIREGVAELASTWNDVEVVATGGSAAEAIRIAKTVSPDVMLLDYNLGGDASAVVCHTISSHYPSIKIVAFTVYDDPAIVMEMIRAGAVGFILKDADADDLHQAIRTAARGESPLDSRITATILETAGGTGDSASRVSGLDPNEELLLGMVAAGLSNREIAARLYVSEKTVKNSLTRLYKKLGVERRAQAAAIGVRYGYHVLAEKSLT